MDNQFAIPARSTCKSTINKKRQLFKQTGSFRAILIFLCLLWSGWHLPAEAFTNAGTPASAQADFYHGNCDTRKSGPYGDRYLVKHGDKTIHECFEIVKGLNPNVNKAHLHEYAPWGGALSMARHFSVS